MIIFSLSRSLEVIVLFTQLTMPADFSERVVAKEAS